MFNPQDVKKALEELERLNGNLEKLHSDMDEIRSLNQNARHLGSLLRDSAERLKSLPIVAKQLGYFVQIMSQAKQKAGTVGMIQTLLEGLLRATGERR